MAIIQYLKNGKKLYEVYINGYDSANRRFQKRRRNIDSRRKAELVEFELKRELAKLKEQKVHPTWEEWLDESIKIMQVTYRPSTLYSYEKTVNKWLKHCWKSKDLGTIEKIDVHHLIHNHLPPEATMHTRKYVLKIIKRIFQMAVDHGTINQNPCNGLMVKVPETEKKVLTNKEVEIFLREAKETNHRFYPIWVVALFTGLRSGELYALK